MFDNIWGPSKGFLPTPKNDHEIKIPGKLWLWSLSMYRWFCVYLSPLSLNSFFILLQTLYLWLGCTFMLIWKVKVHTNTAEQSHATKRSMFNSATPHTSITLHTQLTLNVVNLPLMTPKKNPQMALMNCYYWVLAQIITSWTFWRLRKIEGLTCAQCPWPSLRSGSTRLQGNQSFQSWSSCACPSGWCDCDAWSKTEGIHTASRRWSHRETISHSSEGWKTFETDLKPVLNLTLKPSRSLV